MQSKFWTSLVRANLNIFNIRFRLDMLHFKRIIWKEKQILNLCIKLGYLVKHLYIIHIERTKKKYILEPR